MTAITKTTYVAIFVLVALLIISAITGVYYYSEYEQEAQSKKQYVSELVSVTSQYDRVASSYNSSLSLENKTLSLLVGTIGVGNTSLPIFKQANTELSELWDEYLSLKPAKSSLYFADILVNFGNGTKQWYNDTQVQPGWNMYTATVVLTNGNLQAQWNPEYQEHFVSGIDGISNSQSMYWWLWTYNNKTLWQIAQVGADDLPVYNGSVFAWTYCGETSSYAPTCVP